MKAAHRAVPDGLLHQVALVGAFGLGHGHLEGFDPRIAFGFVIGSVYIASACIETVLCGGDEEGVVVVTSGNSPPI